MALFPSDLLANLVNAWCEGVHRERDRLVLVRATKPGLVEDDAGVGGGGGADDDDDDIYEDGAQGRRLKRKSRRDARTESKAESYGPQK